MKKWGIPFIAATIKNISYTQVFMFGCVIKIKKNGYTELEKTVYQINGIQTPGMFNARTVIKIKRNPILPKSFAIEAQKTNGSCNEPDVIKQLKDDSNDKCYIQENIRRWKKRIEQQEIQELMESLYI
jgi:hypothetical protein